MKIINVVGARPNFMKIAPLIDEYKKYKEIESILVHTGQHYDKEMSEGFFNVLDISLPDYNLGVGSGTHAEQTAKIILGFEKVCKMEKPDLVLVVGDVNSTIACSLVAKKMGIKVAHVEAGLRSFDESMPEEINRILTDKISDLLFVTEESGIKNLKKEDIENNKIFYVGNIMIDSLIRNLDKIENSKIIEEKRIERGDYLVLTLHRPSNVDNKEILEKLIDCIKEIQEKTKIVFPMHPRTKKRIEEFGFNEKINSMKNLVITEPMNYIDFMSVVKNSKGVLTDSGGIQEETTFLKIPCITLRENTERPVTIEKGTNKLVGTNTKKILEEIDKIINKDYKEGEIPDKWDGRTAERIVEVLLEKLGRGKC